MGEGVAEGAAHGKARDPGVLQPHPERPDRLPHLVHQPGQKSNFHFKISFISPRKYQAFLHVSLINRLFPFLQCLVINAKHLQIAHITLPVSSNKTPDP